MPPQATFKSSVQRLAWSDPHLDTISCPRRPMELVASFGSGLTRKLGDAPGIVWAIGDRGPNLKVEVARKRYGLDHLSGFEKLEGAKLMPRPELGPAMAELRVLDDQVELIRTIRLSNEDGSPMSGIPTPGGGHAKCEPAFSLEGQPLEPDPRGADTEGIAALEDGSFFIGDEYGPALLKVGANGRVEARWSLDVLPEIAGKRQLNRGFEAISLTPDEKWLYLAFQSPLAHPDEDAHEAARHVRIWRLDASNGQVSAQYLYPLDPPESFRRDCDKGEFGRSDIKVSEIIAESDDLLLVLERGSETTKLYRVCVDPSLAVGTEHLRISTRPTIEEISAAGGDLPEFAKQLVLDTDDHSEVAADLEGMVILSPTELLLVSDNDFGVEGAETSFWRVKFEEPIFGNG